MPTYPASSPPPARLRDLRRDRSILALAAALCGAISAAGIVAVAVASQLSTDHRDHALGEATATLASATQQLEAARHEIAAQDRELEATRRELRELRRDVRDGSRCKKRKHDKHGKHGKHHRHGPRHEGTLQVMPAPAPATFSGPVTTTITHAGLSCPSEHHCQLHREFVDATLSQPEALARSARVVPSIRDGVQAGVKLYGIESGSLLKQLGFKNGDLVRAVNDQPMTSMGEATETVVNLARDPQPTVTVTLERKGEELTKRFDIL
ncbi:MAG: hypothetical protein KC486_29720 [Myxococcales bacterium]|nr:hypothetical protein [Myxococcales bacterium]